ncbi:MAG: IPT/TIG domain-containing protein, partial [Dysgonamonadaceae bacterium]|nr:IPT/TIG domain-containing protein [Dysgonamonadaceae bacterium]
MESRLRYIILMLAIACMAALRVTAQTPGGVNMAINGYVLDLWVDGDHSTDNSWNNIANPAYSLVKFSTNAPIVQDSKFNYHKELYFGNTNNSKLRTSTSYNLLRGESYYIFVVSDASSIDNTNNVLLCFSESDNATLLWNASSATTNILSSYWTNTLRSTNFNLTANPRYGIVTMNIANASNSPLDMYLNGRKASFTLGTGNNSNGSAQYNVPLIIGNVNNNTTTGTRYAFNGSIQEIIIVRKTSASALMPDVDLAKIHSYLAIKYGLELKKADGSAQDNIVNSDNTPVWNIANGAGVHADNATYSHNVFGIGRDDASGLNQKQSQSINDKQLAVALGTFAASNTLNTNAFSQNKTFLMLGSNGTPEGKEPYNHTTSETYSGGVHLTDDVNFRSATVWKASIMTNGAAGGSMTNISMEVNKSPVRQARYLLVGTDPLFAPGSTRIYSLSDLKAGNVTVNDGDYIAFAWYSAAAPGGATGAGTYMAWLTPDSYDKATGWMNLIENMTGNFIQPASWSTKTMPEKAAGQNFQPAVQFRPVAYSNIPNRLQSENGINLTASDAFTFILVYKATNAGFQYQNILNFAGSSEYNLSQYSLGYLEYTGSNANILSMGWPANRRALGAAPYDVTALVTIDNNNQNIIRHYQNGSLFPTAFASANGSINNQIVLGGSYYSLAGNGARGINADIQEIIILKRPRTTYPFLADINSGNELKKIHSYLAIKYGISLENGNNTGANYINSDGNPVWDRSVNSGYNYNFIGIGRDDAAGLNQVQSKNAESTAGADMFTIYKGTRYALNNNSSKELNNGDFLMLGSNGLIGNINYVYPAGTDFGGSITTEKINYRSAAVYKAQVTTAGAPGGSQTVNMEVVSGTAKYVLVSYDPTFADLTQIKIYPITAMKATVPVGNGQYLTTAGLQTAPGGLTDPNVIAMWFTGDSYSNSVWTNLIGGAIGNFTQPSTWSDKIPPAKQAGQNFHPAVQFRPAGRESAQNRMISDKGINLTANDAFTFILVYKAVNAGDFEWQRIFDFYNDPWNYGMNRYALGYNTPGSNVLTMAWPDSKKTLGAVPYGATAIVTIDNNNNNAIKHYLNSRELTTAGSASGAINDQIVLGGCYWDLTGDGARGANADIQEIIMLQRPKATYPLLEDIHSANDFKQIHTYLAVKYGMTLTHDYLATDGTKVWDRTANTGYNNHIFGIARDDLTGLYQKQSVSVSNDLLTMFIGNKLEKLNSQNTATLDDMQYVMIGSDGNPNIVIPAHISNDSTYANGKLTADPELNYKSGAIYLAQLTRVDSIDVKFQTAIGYSHVFVSKSPNFIGAETRFYTVAELNGSYVATVPITKEYKYIRFGGYSAGPGGIHAGLLLWLNAGDRAAIATEDFTDISGNIANYSPYGSLSMPINGVYPAVKTWSDPIRSINYNYISETKNSMVSRMPMYSPYNREMNYHPSVHFWGNESTYGAYLRNTIGLFSSANPVNYEFSAIFVVNNDKAINNERRSYYMGFGENGNYISGYWPIFGIIRDQNNASISMSAFNTSSYSYPKVSSLIYTTGSTAIMGYRTRTTGGASNGKVKFSVDGISDEVDIDFGSMNMNTHSVVGTGYVRERQLKGLIAEGIIFDRNLPDNEIDKINSYLAIKYGITLKKSAAENYNYLFSDSVVFWPGQSDPRFQPFHHNVAAVISDRSAKLNNRQSHSTGSGSLMHMGVTGKYLASNGGNSEVGSLENDKEALVWGSNSETGLLDRPPGTCGDYQKLFGKKWLVYKKTKNDRPLSMLVGAQNNKGNNLGMDAPQEIKAMYDILTANYDLYLLVADSPDKLDPSNAAFGDFKAIVPMAYVNREHQCNYTFTDTLTYVTFGYKPNTAGCESTIQFTGKKIFEWKQWTLQKYNINGASAITIGKDTVDLGDGMKAVSKIAYDNGVCADNNYPRVTGSPSGAIEIQRYKGAVGSSKVAAIVTFNAPVLPDFSISGLDAGWNQQYDEVTVTGYCSGNPVYPSLSHAGLPQNAAYKIKGHKATVDKNRLLSPADKNGTVNVEFNNGVDSLVIEYTLQNRVYGSARQQIFIGPVNIGQVPPPPPINEDGVSFVKQVADHVITTCENADYTFYLQNTNCADKYVYFRDELPDGMTWKAGSIGLDSINGLINTKLNIPEYAGSKLLQIDSLVIPGVSTIKLTATAEMDKDAKSADYANRASIQYMHIKNSITSDTTAYSVDRETLQDSTVFYASEQTRLDTLILAATASSDTYLAEQEIDVTITLDNPNIPIDSAYLNIEWGAGFTYQDGSLAIDGNTAYDVFFSPPTPADPIGSLYVAGTGGEDKGFTLSGHGESTVIQLKLKAPAEMNLAFERDAAGNPTGLISSLHVHYEFSTSISDPCMLKAMGDMRGNIEVPALGVKRIFVDEQATQVTSTTGLNNGTSWENAFVRFADAIEVARNYPYVDSVLVAKGTYRPFYLPAGAPSSISESNNTFNLPDSLNIFGGFDNGLNGTAYDLDNRPEKDLTVLSGKWTRGGIDYYAYHVLMAIGSRGIEMDGFSVEDGYALGGDSLIVNNVEVRRYHGAGAYIADTASIMFRNMAFKRNRASAGTSDVGGGGAIYSERKSSVIIENSHFTSNIGNTFGGSIMNSSEAVITARNLTFTTDDAQTGGSIANFSVLHLDSAHITGSRAGVGAAIYSAGSTNINRLVIDDCQNTQTSDNNIIYSDDGSRLLLSNSLLRGNKGGIISNNARDSLINCTLAGNRGTAIKLTSGSELTLVNSIVYGNENGVDDAGGTYTQKNSLVQGREDTSNANIKGSTDPRFAAPADYASAPSTGGDYHVQIGSPIVNRGDSTYVKDRFPVDLDGATRIRHQVDMGAYEEQSDHMELKRAVPDFGPNIGGRYTNNSATGSPFGVNTTGVIALVGEGFLHGIATVTFGGLPATIAGSPSNDTLLLCIPPAVTGSTLWIENDTLAYDSKWKEGTVKIILTTSGGLQDSIYYRYRQPITIDSISPDNGPLTGGTQVTIYGHNFLPHDGSGSDNTGVVFSLLPNDADSAGAAIVSITNDTIIVTTSAHPVNYVAVTVDNALEKTSLTGNPLPFAYYPTTFIVNGQWSEAHKWEYQTSDNILPYPGADIHIKANCEQNIDVDMDSITVYPGKAYTLNAGKTLDANVFTLKDNASFLNNYGNM